MKVVLSRKGFDGAAGGRPSPIINGQPISLPIPYPNSTKSFRDVGLEKIVTDLTKSKISPEHGCHFDPDLDIGAFGQEFTAQSHLDNHNIGSGDLFLFFGWFKEAETFEGRYQYKKGAKDHHRIFGWMFVDQKVTVGSETGEFRQKYPNCADHPHAIGNWKSNNTIYIAPETFTLFGERRVRGFGKFCQSDETLLTDKQAPSKRFWGVPDWLNPKKGGCIPSYHFESSYENGFLKTAGRGQEFVCEPQINKNFKACLLDIFDRSI